VIKHLRIEELDVGRLRVQELEVVSGGPSGDVPGGPSARGVTAARPASGEAPLGPPD
jgi:hypothetical protein